MHESKPPDDARGDGKSWMTAIRHLWERAPAESAHSNEPSADGPLESRASIAAAGPPIPSQNPVSQERPDETAAPSAILATSDELLHLLGVLTGVTTALWRARGKLSPQMQAALPPELRLLPRHLDAAWDAVASGGIELPDQKDQRFVPGLAVNPVAFQPTDGIGCDVIQEVLKPSIYYKGVLVQRADVIVATPIGDAPASDASNAD
jgi:hypothetical protein